MSFDEFIGTAWNEHAEQPQLVAERLADSLHVIETAEQIPAYARLTTHVFGEHLGQWNRGIALLEALRGVTAFDDSPPLDNAVVRGVAVLRYASGDRRALELLAPDDRVSVLATASSALAGRKEFKLAIAAYSEALGLVSPGLPAGSPALRALAIGGNNLAAALEAKEDRDAPETKGMLAAAEGGLKYWKQAGTWLEEERAEYRLTRSLLQAGEANSAVESARRCIAVCAANNAPAFEQFFGHAALALALRAAGDGEGFNASRAQALRLFELVAPDEQAWCKAELAELGG
jgi:hypothetical protein